MKIVYALTPKLRIKLKEPFGLLIQGSFDQTMSEMKALADREKPPRIISVGDVVSRNLHEHNIHPQLTVIDNKSLRSQSMPETSAEAAVHVCNPQGTITDEAISAIKEAIEKNRHVHIVVDGEEDLLTLIAVLFAPENSFVVYGQPHLGIVVVKVTGEKKLLAEEFLKEMETLRKAK